MSSTESPSVGACEVHKTPTNQVSLVCWQLKNVLKHVSYITGCDLSCLPKLLSSFADNIVSPKPGNYRHETRTARGKSVAHLFVHFISQPIVESLAGISDASELYSIIGHDHGIGAF
jgi:hypothetical protein